MILGLPADTWVLILGATLPGLLLVLMAYWAHKDDTGGDPETDEGAIG